MITRRRSIRNRTFERTRETQYGRNEFGEGRYKRVMQIRTLEKSKRFRGGFVPSGLLISRAELSDRNTGESINQPVIVYP